MFFRKMSCNGYLQQVSNLSKYESVAWGNGVQYYRSLSFERAEKWMSIAISLLNKYHRKSDYSDLMDDYSEVLRKKTQTANNNVTPMDVIARE